VAGDAHRVYAELAAFVVSNDAAMRLTGDRRART
jgi:hypothetical protein